MAYELSPFQSIPLDDALLEMLIGEHESITLPRLRRLWSYFRNALSEPTPSGGSTGAPAQAAGLPLRLQNPSTLEGEDETSLRKEVVIENDIAWRIHTLVDFMFPESPTIRSTAPDVRRASEIEGVLNAVFKANGATALWQDAALLGSVYGHVDFLLNCRELDRIGAAGRRSNATSRRQGDTELGNSNAGATSHPATSGLSPEAIASRLVIEAIEPTRAIPLLNHSDYRRLDAYILHFQQLVNEADRSGLLARLSRAMRSGSSAPRRGSITITEIISPTFCQRYEDGKLVMETLNRLGRLPVVHVQNLSQPLMYAGLSDVEPLIPLQDELNTRLSDRANRVTMQSFRMWLGKGIEDFADHPVGPGQMWVTENLDASIDAFGGDADSPSETAHIEQLREAMDKTSGVTPAAAGHIRARVGNLTSENALRISLMGTIAKTRRKRVTYGTGIKQLSELILHALDVYSVFHTRPEERGVELTWTDPIASDESRRIADALAKAQLGVSTSVLRAELGYAETDE